MGKTSDEPGEPLGPGGQFEDLTWSEARAWMIEKYAFRDVGQFNYALEQLDGIEMQEREEAASEMTYSDRRKRARAALKAIQKEARFIRSSAAAMREAEQQFRLVLADENRPASLVENIFDTKQHHYTDIVSNSLFDFQRSIFFKPELWSIIEEQIDIIEAIPILQRSKEGKVFNRCLQRALIVCRSYLETENIGWGVSTIQRSKKIREDNDIEKLKGKCERAVVDMLTYGRIKFDLVSLNGMWKKVPLDTKLMSAEETVFYPPF